MVAPPPLPKKFRLPFSVKVGLVPVLLLCAIVAFAVLAGRLRVLFEPTEGMKPAISPRSYVIMEGFTYMFRSPRESEIVVFYTDHELYGAGRSLYLKRIVGKPGDSLRISDGKLYVNGQHLPLTNAEGAITYVNLRESAFLSSNTETLTVPEGHYFLLGDNSARSLDSRFFGSVPVENIRGRILGRR
jgi:signal peptidase I